MARNCGIIILASMLMVFSVQASEITVHRNLNPADLIFSDGFHHFVQTPGPLYAPPGAPELPHAGHQILLPPGEEIISVRLDNEVWQMIPGQINLWPAQAPIPYSKSEQQTFTSPDESIYNSDIVYPESSVELARTDFLSGHGIGSVSITTARYQPASGVLEVLISYDLVLETTPTARAQESLTTFYRQTTHTLARLNRQAENLEALDLYPASDEVDEIGPKYLIITTADFTEVLQMLVDHRVNRGLQVEVVLVEDIEGSYLGIDTADKIRNCITDYYINHALKYVLLCGDVEHVPTRGLYAAIGSTIDEDIAADIYFSNLDGNWNEDGDNRWGEPAEADLYYEVAIGRFSVDDYGEAYDMIYKTIGYENTPVTADLEKALMVGEDLGWVSWGGEYKDEIRYGSSNYGYTTAGFPANFNVDVLYDMYGTWSSMYQLLPLLNGGLNLGNHLGHASNSWTMKFSTSQVNAINMTNNGINHNFYILYTQGCYGGSFDNRTVGGSYTSDCICEAFTTIQTGAVAFLCNSRYGWGSGNNTNGPSQYYDRQFFDALFSENIYNIGWINADSKEDNIPFIGGASYWVYYEMNLLGDPALDIWTGQPNTFAPIYPDTVILGTTQVEVEVGVFGAQVAILFENAMIGAAVSDPLGNAIIILEEPISVPGELTLCIAAHNYLPFQGTIVSAASEGPYVMMYDPYFDDSVGGNGDGNPELGETLLFSAEFENVGVEDATGLTAVMECSEACVGILQESVSIGDLMVGESIQIMNAFEVELLPTVHDEQEITFQVIISDDQGNSWPYEHEIVAFAPDLQLVSFSMDDGNDGHLMPGEAATINLEICNEGHSATTDLTILLSTDNPLALVNSPAYSMPALEATLTGMVEDLQITVNPSIMDPSALVLYLNATDTRNYQDNFLIEIPVGGEFNDMESGVGEWTHAPITMGWGDQWNLAELMNHTPGGTAAWYCGQGGQYSELLDAGLLTPEYQVYGKHLLSFYHWMSAELSSSYPGYCYDGGVVEMSLNGAPFEQLTPRGGYPFMFRDGSYPGPLPEGTPCFSGQIAWNEVVFDIEGEGTAQFRYRFISDGAISSIGWFIDDFELVRESTPNAPTDLEAFLIDDEVTLTWHTPGLGEQLAGAGKNGDRTAQSLEQYRIYRDGMLIDSIEALSYVDNLSNQSYGPHMYQVSGVFDGVEGSLSEPVSVDYVGIRSESTGALPSVTTLRSAYPNPFNPVVSLNFDLAVPERVTLSVYDLMGRTVATILNSPLEAGSHMVQWDAGQHASGMYLVQMKAGSYTGMHKVLLIK